MSPLPNADRRLLLDVARRAIYEAVNHNRLLDPPTVPASLNHCTGAFVTLHSGGQLRGCMGQLRPADPLVHTIIHCAAAAALDDPRFRPVGTSDIDRLEIEISVLTQPESLPADQWEKIKIGTHGILISRGSLQGLLLPQVALERHWTTERFLEETCQKAGLEPAAWRDPATIVEVFTAEVFSDASVPAPQELP